MADRANGILLDSSIVIAYFRGRLDLFSLLDPGEEAYLPLVVLAELYKGAEKSTRTEENLRQVDDFLRRASLLHPDISTAKIYATIAATLEAEGQSLAEHDTWIAAAELEFDMPLATRDAHFDRVSGLTVLTW